MADARRVNLTPLGPSRKEKKAKKEEKTFRFDLKLSESTEVFCPEFNYAELVNSRTKKSETNTSLNGSDPVEAEDDSNLRAIAKRFEAKYGTSTGSTRKRPGRFEDYSDLGAGYDESDSFIDNTDAIDELVPDNATTIHGGFYINSGQLHFKEVEMESEHSNGSEKIVVQPTKRKKSRVIESDNEEDTAAASREALRKKILKSKKKALDGLRRTNKNYTVKDLLDQKRLKDTTVQQQQVVPESNTNLEKKTASTASICDAIESVVSAARQDDISAKQLPALPVDIIANPSSPSSLSDTEETSEVGDPVPLPEYSLPEQLVAVVTQLKGVSNGTEGKCRYFSSEVNGLLLQVESLSRSLPGHLRNQVFAHLASHLPCTKETLIKRAKKLAADQIEASATIALGKLRDAVSRAENDAMINYLLEATKAKVQYFELIRPRKETAEDFIKSFLERSVLPIWPPGKVTLVDLYTWSSAAHVSLTSRKKRRHVDSPVPMDLDPTPSGSTTPFTPTEPNSPELTPLQKEVTKHPKVIIETETKTNVEQTGTTATKSETSRTEEKPSPPKDGTLSLFAKLKSEMIASQSTEKTSSSTSQLLSPTPKVSSHSLLSPTTTTTQKISPPVVTVTKTSTVTAKPKSNVTFADSLSSSYATALDRTDVFESKRSEKRGNELPMSSYLSLTGDRQDMFDVTKRSDTSMFDPTRSFMDNLYKTTMSSFGKAKLDESRSKPKPPKVSKPSTPMTTNSPMPNNLSDMLGQIIRADLAGYPSGQDIIAPSSTVSSNKPLDMCTKPQTHSTTSVITSSKPIQVPNKVTEDAKIQSDMEKVMYDLLLLNQSAAQQPKQKSINTMITKSNSSQVPKSSSSITQTPKSSSSLMTQVPKLSSTVPSKSTPKPTLLPQVIPTTKPTKSSTPTHPTFSQLPTGNTLGFQDAFFKHLQSDRTSSPDSSPQKDKNSSTIGWDSHLGNAFPSSDFYASLMGAPFNLDPALYISTTHSQTTSRNPYQIETQPKLSPNSNNKQQRTFM